MPRRAHILALVFLVVAAGAILMGLPERVEAPPVGQLETIQSGLVWPVAFEFAPDGRLFFVERLSGRIRIYAGGGVLPDPFYTIPSVGQELEQGLLGLELHPDFASQPWVYAYYTFDDTANASVYNRIVRILASGDTGTTLEVVMDRIPAASIHNGGVIGFGPDGKLYAVVGENSVKDLAQDLTVKPGKVLRMNPDGSVPPDNPFLSTPGADRYVYTYGHRNMFGLAFHPVTQRAYVTENGPNCNDEVNLLAAGRNYGWGPEATCLEPPPPPANTNLDGPSPVFPIAWYGSVIAPTNAIVYDGPNFRPWRYDLFFGDWLTSSLRRLDLEPPNYDTVLGESVVLTVPDDFGVLDVEVGPDGQIWLTTSTALYRFVDVSQPPTASFARSPVDPLVGETVTFDASGSTDPDSSIVSYAWNFGDGQSGAGVAPTHSYATYGSYMVRLTVTDDQGLSDSFDDTLLVWAPPTASFAFTPSNPLPAETVTFNASGSSDPDGTIVRYDWAWDDGTSTNGLTGPTATHAYASYGTYRVVLTVTDDDGLARTAARDVRVGTSPSAEFTFDPSLPRPGELVTFDGSASSDPDGSIASYAWDFGDGGTASGVTATHAYATSGTYVVTLTVVDNASLPDSTNASIRVNAPPVAAFSATPSVGFLGGPVQFDGGSSSDGDGTIVAYAWDFGDGGTGSGRNLIHAYDAREDFLVRLVVTDDDGTTGEVTQTFSVRNRAPVIASASPDGEVRIALGVSVRLSVNASDPDGDPVAYAWSVDGEARGESGSEIVFRPDHAGSFSVNVTVRDGSLSVSREWTVIVESPPDVASLVLWPAVATGFIVAVGAAFLFLRRARPREGDEE